jgi:hypothetical protein
MNLEFSLILSILSDKFQKEKPPDFSGGFFVAESIPSTALGVNISPYLLKSKFMKQKF